MEPKDDLTAVPWQFLPSELWFKIFGFSEFPTLQKFALSSKASADMVLGYLQTSEGLRRIEREVYSTNHCCNTTLCLIRHRSEVGVNLGTLMTAATLFCKASDKILIVQNMLQKGQFPRFCMNISQSFLTCFGNFANTFIRGWPMESLAFVHNCLNVNSNIQEYIKIVLPANPGYYAPFEMYVRDYFREIYFDASDDNNGYWLHIILRPFSYAHQAKLLYLLFGPVRENGCIDWDAPSTDSNVFSFMELDDLAKAVACLVNNNQHFIDDLNISSFFRKLLLIPRSWHPANLAYFTMTCGKRFLTSAMTFLLSNGRRYMSLSIFVIYCSMVCLKLVRPIDSLIDVLVEIIELPEVPIADRQSFCRFFPNFLSDIATRGSYVHEFRFGVAVLKKSVYAILACLLKNQHNFCHRFYQL